MKQLIVKISLAFFIGGMIYFLTPTISQAAPPPAATTTTTTTGGPVPVEGGLGALFLLLASYGAVRMRRNFKVTP